MMSVLSNSVLVLNTSFLPIDVINVYEASKKVCREDPRARFVDPETYMSYDYESWIDTWEDAIRSSKLSADKALQSSCMAFRIPEVIILTKYDGDGSGERYRDKDRPPKFSRRNVYLRDSHTCQYCNKRCDTSESNLDHVIPKSKGGEMNWGNIVVSCIPCNTKKGGRTPSEAGMRLIKKPTTPAYGELKKPFGAKLRRKLKGNALPSWENFLGKIYWEISLKD
jgi:5-methylcytosine-specific restriction endonuclease McrA